MHERALRDEVARITMERMRSADGELQFIQERAGFTIDGIPFNGPQLQQLAHEDKGWSPVGKAGDEYDPYISRTLVYNYLAKRYQTDPVCRNIINNYLFFTFGKGFDVIFESDQKNGRFNDWAGENKWHARSKKFVLEQFLFGEALAVLFPLTWDDGKLGEVRDRVAADKYRYVPGARIKEIKQDPEDWENILGYKLTGFRGDGWVNPNDIVPFVNEGIGTSVRGTSVVTAVLQDLVKLEKFCTSRFYLNELRARLPVVRKYKKRQQQVIERQSGTWDNLPPAGTMATEGPDGEWIFPSLNIDSSGVQHDLRAITLRIGAGTSLPEYLVMQDASNNNFASLIVAESPVHHLFRSLQVGFKAQFTKLLTAVGFDGFTIEPSPVIPRDLEKEAKALEIAERRQWISRQTAAERMGFNWVEEQRRMLDDNNDGELFPDPADD